MSNDDGTIWTIFNGEIYNHHDLRHYLEGKGHIFRGHSDTEVLPRLYEEEGPAFVNRLRGMFALAILDTRHRTLLLARDRFGIKPLFYAPSKESLVFASEINALRSIPGIDSRPDHQAVHDFAALSYIPAPLTFFRGIRALQPGEILTARIQDDEVLFQTHFYHRWSLSINPSLSLNEATDRAEVLVNNAVRSQLESDVPLGTLLSGGIDSSLVSDAAQATIANGLRTFNVRFRDPAYDETWAAIAVARKIGSHHETLEINESEGSWDEVVSLLTQAGQPFADTSLFAVNKVCKLMRQHVTVALSGDGGDESFGGYDVYRRLSAIATICRMPAPLSRAAWHGTAVALGQLSRAGLAPVHHSNRARNMANADETGIIQNLFCPVPADEHQKLCRSNDALPVRRYFEREWDHQLPRGASTLDRLSARVTEVNTRLQMANAFLFKVDTASMKESLEVRVPMLDEELFAFGVSLPHSLKVRGQQGKVVLRALARRRLPQEVSKKPKQGFGIPVDKWVDSSFKSRLKETLLGSDKLEEFFEPKVYKPQIEAFCEGRSYPGVHRSGLYSRAIMFLSVHLAASRTASTN
jgi:asparagine synthase (glutamine-hydrolysing)